MYFSIDLRFSGVRFFFFFLYVRNWTISIYLFSRSQITYSLVFRCFEAEPNKLSISDTVLFHSNIFICSLEFQFFTISHLLPIVSIFSSRSYNIFIKVIFKLMYFNSNMWAMWLMTLISNWWPLSVTDSDFFTSSLWVIFPCFFICLEICILSWTLL